MNLPKLVVIQNINNCNLKCIYCPIFGKGSLSIPTDDTFNIKLLYKIIHELKEVNYQEGIWFGQYCEPLVDKNIVNISHIPYKNGMYSGIFTNGVLLKKQLENGLEIKYAYVSLLGDLDGEFSYKKITGLDYDKTIDTILYARDKGVSINIVATLTFKNELTIRYLAKRLKDYPDINILLGGLDSGTTEVIPPKIINQYIKLMYDLHPKSGISVSIANLIGIHNHPPGYMCQLTNEVLSIRLNGDVELCCMSNHIIDNISNRNCIDIFNSSMFKSEDFNSHIIDQCRTCKLSYMSLEK